MKKRDLGQQYKKKGKLMCSGETIDEKRQSPTPPTRKGGSPQEFEGRPKGHQWLDHNIN
jgi:hypothetical protein